MELSPTVEALTRVFTQDLPLSKEGMRFNVSRTVSVFAVLYEKARNAVEFRAEHLIRRAAIERILKRKILINGGARNIAESLITELLWARYIDSSIIDEEKIAEIQKIIDRYLVVKHHLPTIHQKSHNITWDAVIGLASSEIDETMVSAKRREALIQFCYQATRPKITLPHTDEFRTNILTYIAVERAYAQADNQLIAFHLLNMTMPEWLSMPTDKVVSELPRFWEAIGLIQQNINDHTADPIYRYVRLHIAPFLLIRDFYFDVGSKADEFIKDDKKMEEKLTELATLRYKQTGTKVRRAVIRSFIYIFLTKMLFALALEAPYDIYIAKKLSYIPLIINMIFPPIMLVLIAGMLTVPGAENTKRLLDRVKKILYHFDELKHEKDSFTPKEHIRRPILGAIFSVIYIATFGITFGIINYILSLFHFSVASELIFFFFVALVSFFAYRIRQSAKEYEVMDRQGVLEPLVDFFILPVVRAGQLLSNEIARLNIFIFLFDFILEAPLKVIFEVVEEWIRFVRTKKDEIV